MSITEKELDSLKVDFLASLKKKPIACIFSMQLEQRSGSDNGRVAMNGVPIDLMHVWLGALRSLVKTIPSKAHKKFFEFLRKDIDELEAEFIKDN